MPTVTRAAKARNTQLNNPPNLLAEEQPVQEVTKAVKPRKRGKKAEDDQEKAEKVKALRRYQEAQVAAHTDMCTTPAGPSVGSVQGMDKPTTKAASTSRKSLKSATKPTDKAIGGNGDSAMELDSPPVLSGTKRVRANLSIDLSTQVSLLKQG